MANNSNQFVGFQGVANTGNALCALGLIQLDDNFDFDDDDFDFDDVGADIDVSPELSLLSDQSVDQSAVASK